MICNLKDDNHYIIRVFNNLCNFDIYNQEEINNFIKLIFNKVLKKYNLQGNILFNIFVDKRYGMIIDVQKENKITNDNIIDIKIRFNLTYSFLYEVDYFYLIENNLSNQNVYYYKSKFYLELVNDLSNRNFLQLLDNTIVIYDNTINEIINNGIKLNL